MKTIAKALNGNPKLNRWRFVVKRDDKSTAHSSPYIYASEGEALEAGKSRAEYAAYCVGVKERGWVFLGFEAFLRCRKDGTV